MIGKLWKRALLAVALVPLLALDGRAAERDLNERQASLSKELSAIPGLQVKVERKGDTTELVAPIGELFAGRKAAISKDKGPLIDSVADVVKRYPDVRISLVGHTDSRGNHKKLMELSTERAEAVFTALVNRGVEPARLGVIGKGPDEPMADNRSRRGRGQNNRVELVFAFP